MKVIITDKIAQKGVDLLKAVGYEVKEAWDEPELWVKAQILAQERFQWDCIIDYDMMGPVEEYIGTSLK